MKDENRTILSLVAAGRISAAEAERLMAVSNADREVFWFAAAVGGVIAAQGILQGLGPGISHLAHALAPGWHWAAQHAIALITKGLGGLR